MKPNTWHFYILRGFAVADSSRSFWKVGTALPTFDEKGKPITFSMRGRTAYGNYVDPTLTRTGQDRVNAVYAAPQNNNIKISYRPPHLGMNAVADRIKWHPVVTHAIVATKELDQLIAAFSDDIGGLIHNRGQLLFSSPIRKFRGAIELINGNIDIYDLISAIATTPNTISRRKLSESMRADIEQLDEQLRFERENLKGNLSA